MPLFKKEAVKARKNWKAAKYYKHIAKKNLRSARKRGASDAEIHQLTKLAHIMENRVKSTKIDYDSNKFWARPDRLFQTKQTHSYLGTVYVKSGKNKLSSDMAHLLNIKQNLRPEDAYHLGQKVDGAVMNDLFKDLKNSGSVEAAMEKWQRNNLSFSPEQIPNATGTVLTDLVDYMQNVNTAGQRGVSAILQNSGDQAAAAIGLSEENQAHIHAVLEKEINLDSLTPDERAKVTDIHKKFLQDRGIAPETHSSATGLRFTNEFINGLVDKALDERDPKSHITSREFQNLADSIKAEGIETNPEESLKSLSEEGGFGQEQSDQFKAEVKAELDKMTGLASINVDDLSKDQVQAFYEATQKLSDTRDDLTDVWDSLGDEEKEKLAFMFDLKDHIDSTGSYDVKDLDDSQRGKLKNLFATLRDKQPEIEATLNKLGGVRLKNAVENFKKQTLEDHRAHAKAKEVDAGAHEAYVGVNLGEAVAPLGLPQQRAAVASEIQRVNREIAAVEEGTPVPADLTKRKKDLEDRQWEINRRIADHERDIQLIRGFVEAAPAGRAEPEPEEELTPEQLHQRVREMIDAGGRHEELYNLLWRTAGGRNWENLTDALKKESSVAVGKGRLMAQSDEDKREELDSDLANHAAYSTVAEDTVYAGFIRDARNAATLLKRATEGEVAPEVEIDHRELASLLRLKLRQSRATPEAKTQFEEYLKQFDKGEFIQKFSEDTLGDDVRMCKFRFVDDAEGDKVLQYKRTGDRVDLDAALNNADESVAAAVKRIALKQYSKDAFDGKEYTELTDREKNQLDQDYNALQPEERKTLLENAWENNVAPDLMHWMEGLHTVPHGWEEIPGLKEVQGPKMTPEEIEAQANKYFESIYEARKRVPLSLHLKKMLRKYGVRVSATEVQDALDAAGAQEETSLLNFDSALTSKAFAGFIPDGDAVLAAEKFMKDADWTATDSTTRQRVKDITSSYDAEDVLKFFTEHKGLKFVGDTLMHKDGDAWVPVPSTREGEDHVSGLTNDAREIESLRETYTLMDQPLKWESFDYDGKTTIENIDAVLMNVRLFPGQPAVTEKLARAWLRNYAEDRLTSLGREKFTRDELAETIARFDADYRTAYGLRDRSETVVQRTPFLRGRAAVPLVGDVRSNEWEVLLEPGFLFKKLWFVRNGVEIYDKSQMRSTFDAEFNRLMPVVRNKVGAETLNDIFSRRVELLRGSTYFSDETSPIDGWVPFITRKEAAGRGRGFEVVLVKIGPNGAVIEVASPEEHERLADMREQHLRNVMANMPDAFEPMGNISGVPIRIPAGADAVPTTLNVTVDESSNLHAIVPMFGENYDLYSAHDRRLMAAIDSGDGSSIMMRFYRENPGLFVSAADLIEPIVDTDGRYIVFPGADNSKVNYPIDGTKFSVNHLGMDFDLGTADGRQKIVDLHPTLYSTLYKWNPALFAEGAGPFILDEEMKQGLLYRAEGSVRTADALLKPPSVSESGTLTDGVTYSLEGNTLTLKGPAGGPAWPSDVTYDVTNHADLMRFMRLPYANELANQGVLKGSAVYHNPDGIKYFTENAAGRPAIETVTLPNGDVVSSFVFDKAGDQTLLNGVPVARSQIPRSLYSMTDSAIIEKLVGKTGLKKQDHINLLYSNVKLLPKDRTDDAILFTTMSDQGVALKTALAKAAGSVFTVGRTSLDLANKTLLEKQIRVPQTTFTTNSREQDITFQETKLAGGLKEKRRWEERVAEYEGDPDKKGELFLAKSSVTKWSEWITKQENDLLILNDPFLAVRATLAASESSISSADFVSSVEKQAKFKALKNNYDIVSEVDGELIGVNLKPDLRDIRSQGDKSVGYRTTLLGLQHLLSPAGVPTPAAEMFKKGYDYGTRYVAENTTTQNALSQVTTAVEAEMLRNDDHRVTEIDTKVHSFIDSLLDKNSTGHLQFMGRDVTTLSLSNINHGFGDVWDELTDLEGSKVPQKEAIVRAKLEIAQALAMFLHGNLSFPGLEAK
ncbi:hypothetical protein ACFLQ2_00005, partial [archaeon]